MITNAKTRAREWAFLVAALTLAAGLRLINLSHNPGWYTDEGTHLDIARHLAAGQSRYLAITGSTLLFAKLPLFEGILAGLVRLFGAEMITLRGLAAGLGILSVGVLCWALHRMDVNLMLPGMAASLLATYPAAVLYSRFGFSYNLLALLFILTWLGLVKYRRENHRKWLVLACSAAGLGLITDIMAVTLIPPIILIVALTNWKDLSWSLPVTALLAAIYLGVMLLNSQHAFLFDLRFTLNRLGGPPIRAQMATLIQNYTILMTGDIWFPLGVIGLFTLPDRDLRRISLLLLHFPIVAMGRTVALHSLTFYYMIPLLPMIAVGIAALIDFVRSFVFEEGKQLPGMINLDRVGYVLPVLLLAVLLASSLRTYRQARQGFHTPIDPFLISPEDARQAAQYVNAQLQPGDVVIASPGIAWLIDGDVADFQMAMAATGKATPHLPANLPPERFAFDPHFEQARFVVIDNLWHTWAVIHIPGLSDELMTIRSWEMVFKSGSIEVYESPKEHRTVNLLAGVSDSG